MTRYARQIMLPQVGQAGQDRLSAAHVVVIGAGGLGAPVLPLLAGAGIGRMTIVDPDTVDQSNLHRQHLFTEADIGASKADTAATRCRAINSDISATSHHAALTPLNVAPLCDTADLVLDCADSYAVSYILSDYCFAQNIPMITASALGFSGYVAGTCGTAPSLRALFPDAPDNAANCATAGVMGPVVTALGAMQAQMALNVLLALSPSPLGQILNYDGASGRSSSFRFNTAPEPEHAFRFVHPSELSDADTIVELRPAEEAQTPAHPEAKRILSNDLETKLQPKSTRLALCCATGLRSWRTADRLAQFWPGEIVLVAASTT